jgi:hypothetical protein
MQLLALGDLHSVLMHMAELPVPLNGSCNVHGHAIAWSSPVLFECPSAPSECALELRLESSARSGPNVLWSGPASPAMSKLSRHWDAQLRKPVQSCSLARLAANQCLLDLPFAFPFALPFADPVAPVPATPPAAALAFASASASAIGESADAVALRFASFTRIADRLTRNTTCLPVRYPRANSRSPSDPWVESAAESAEPTELVVHTERVKCIVCCMRQSTEASAAPALHTPKNIFNAS